MKTKFISILTLFLLVISLSSCDSNNITTDQEITCADIIKVYEEACYDIFHKETTDQDYDWECYVKCTAPNSDDYIFFYIFVTKEEAEEYSSEGEWNILLYLYSIIAADEPIWVSTKTYNNIAIEYTNYYTYKPFKTLI